MINKMRALLDDEQPISMEDLYEVVIGNRVMTEYERNFCLRHILTPTYGKAAALKAGFFFETNSYIAYLTFQVLRKQEKEPCETPTHSPN